MMRKDERECKKDYSSLFILKMEWDGCDGVGGGGLKEEKLRR